MFAQFIVDEDLKDNPNFKPAQTIKKKTVGDQIPTSIPTDLKGSDRVQTVDINVFHKHNEKMVFDSKSQSMYKYPPQVHTLLDHPFLNQFLYPFLENISIICMKKKDISWMLTHLEPEKLQKIFSGLDPQKITSSEMLKGVGEGIENSRKHHYNRVSGKSESGTTITIPQLVCRYEYYNVELLETNKDEIKRLNVNMIDGTSWIDVVSELAKHIILPLYFEKITSVFESIVADRTTKYTTNNERVIDPLCWQELLLHGKLRHEFADVVSKDIILSGGGIVTLPLKKGKIMAVEFEKMISALAMCIGIDFPKYAHGLSSRLKLFDIHYNEMISM